LIGARGGSKGVPKKNILPIAGKPLIAYTIESAIKSKIFSDVIVSTEDKTIAEISKKFGANIPFMRPKELATDNVSFNLVILHAIKKLREMNYDFDVIINRDCTVPFIKNLDITGAINLLNKTKCDSVCGVYKQHLNPYFNMMELENGYLKFSKKTKKKIKNRQEAPIVYQLNGLFVINVKQFLHYKNIYMPKTLPFEIKPETGLMIDTKFEFQIADLMAQGKIKF